MTEQMNELYIYGLYQLDRIEFLNFKNFAYAKKGLN